MTTKQAATIVNNMKQGLTDAKLNVVLDELKMNDKPLSDGERTAIVNEYRQHSWDELDAILDAPKAKKATKAIDIADSNDAVKRANARRATGSVSAKPKATTKAAKGPSRTQRMFEHVLAGHSNAASVELIKKEFGKVPTNVASISWCRSQLHAGTDYAKKFNPKGKKVLTDREAQAKESK